MSVAIRSGAAHRALARAGFAGQEWLKGHDSRRRLRELEASQWWSPERLRALQTERLRGLLLALEARHPYFAEVLERARIDPRAVRDLSVLERLPVTDKPLIRGYGDRWCHTARPRRLRRQQTSGSSGEPFAFWLTPERVSMDVATRRRATRWWGLDVGDSELVLWRSAIENRVQHRLRRLRDALLNTTLLPAERLGEPEMGLLVDRIRRIRPRMIFGYPSVMARLAWHAEAREAGLDRLGIRVAFATSEVLQPEWRAAIARGFGCAVANEYGARDAGLIARECPHGSLHVSAEGLICEVVDGAGRPLGPDRQGELVVTSLLNPDFPLVRYRTGDLGVLGSRRCACGRGLPVLERLQGRANDALLARGGTWVHGSTFNHLLRAVPGIRAYKIVQERIEEVTVYLSVAGTLPEGVQDRLVASLKASLGADTRVQLELTDAIAPEANGKFRHVVCRIPVDTGIRPAAGDATA